MPASSPAQIHRLFQEAFNRGDVEALAALYEPDAVLVLGDKEVEGRDSIRQIFESLVARQGRMILGTRAIVASDLGLALLHGDWVIEYPTGIGADVATRGLSTEVVR